MPNINVQRALAMALVDGGVTFDSIHSSEWMKDRAVLLMKSRVHLQPDPALMDP